MSILKNILDMVTFRENINQDRFVLSETPQEKQEARRNAPNLIDKEPEQQTASGDDTAELNNSAEYLQVSTNLAENKQIIEKLYGLPGNKDVIARRVTIGTDPGINTFIVFIDGMVDKAIQNLLIQALMLFADREAPREKDQLAVFIKEKLLPGNAVGLHANYRDILDGINYGDTAIFIDGCAQGLLVETKGWEHRGVEKSTNEQLIRGPQDSFCETLRINTALVRKIVKNEQLTTDFFIAGSRNRVLIAVMYLRDLANTDLVAEVKRRISSIKTDSIIDSGTLEELIEDSPYNIYPTILATERPDKVASSIIEGRIGIIVDGSPFVLVVPSTMYEMLHTGEEHYSRWQFGTFIRLLRAMAFYLSFLLPGIYLAVVLFHQEMIPTELLLAIAGNREKVPFPSLLEVILMELSFELLREAGLRIPGVMGSTIGIVGALILGQAAVQANIISPILVIIVAVTGLASFAIPTYSLSFTLRIYRFIYIALGCVLGLYGISLGLFVQTILTANLRSFGVPFLAPIGPKTNTGSDVLIRWPTYFNEKMPDYVNPQTNKRQPSLSRGWLKGKDGA